MTKRKSNRKEDKSSKDLSKQGEYKPMDSSAETAVAKQPQKPKPKKVSPKRATVPLSERAKMLSDTSSSDALEEKDSFSAHIKGGGVQSASEKASGYQEVFTQIAPEKKESATVLPDASRVSESKTPGEKSDTSAQIDSAKKEAAQKEEKKRPTLRAPRARSKKEKAALKAQMEQEEAQALLVSEGAANTSDNVSDSGSVSVGADLGKSDVSESVNSASGEPGQTLQNEASNTINGEGAQSLSGQADITAAAATAAADVEGSRQAKEERKRRWKAIPWIKILVGVIAVILVIGASTFSWDRWFRYDDAFDIQGEWQPAGTDAAVVIDGTHIKLTDKVAYSYQLNTQAKTITYTFGDLKGEGRYRFSSDRQQLVIVDGEGYTAVSTLVEDVSWMFDQFIRSLKKEPLELMTASEAARFFTRLSTDIAAIPHPSSGVPTDQAEEPQEALVVGEPTATNAEDDPTKKDEVPAEKVNTDTGGFSDATASGESNTEAGVEGDSPNTSSAPTNTTIDINNISDTA